MEVRQLDVEAWFASSYIVEILMCVLVGGWVGGCDTV